MRATAKHVEEVVENIRELSARFALERPERQRRRELAAADFDALMDAGFHLTGAPPDMGGLNSGVAEFTRPLCEMLRILAHGDPSVALVASMHPAVIGGWLEVAEAPLPYAKAWEKQRRTVFETALNGCWWGTIISEPGSGGDPSKSRATAKRVASDDASYLITGQKHFGSGSGITSFMITQAVPEGEAAPDVFYMDMRGIPWDGSAGVSLTAEWDGHGMTATQSHAMSFTDMPATRAAWPDNRQRQRAREIAGRPAGHLFTSVIVGVVEAAVDAARQQVRSKRDAMRPFEQVEWSRVEMEAWLIQQAYEGVLRDVESGGNTTRSGLLCKEAVAELAESALLRISKALGGGAYSRSTPYGFWLQDVRALGFLRPPWGFAFDRIFDGATRL